MKVGIVVGSIREQRLGAQVGAWIAEVAAKRDGEASYELIELADFDVPLFTAAAHPMAARKSYDDERVQRWSDAIDACDAFVFVTAEYNHSVPGAFKNAVDSLGGEWMGKPVGFVGYGVVGGVRAIEHWRTIVANFSMTGVRAEVNLSTFSEVVDGRFTPADRREGELNTVFDQVEAAAARG